MSIQHAWDTMDTASRVVTVASLGLLATVILAAVILIPYWDFQMRARDAQLQIELAHIDSQRTE